MTEIDSILRELILRHVPVNGASIGDKALLERLAQSLDGEVSEEDFRRVRDALIAEGLLASGRGRGGSVMRAVPADHEGDEPLLNVQVQVAPPKAAPRGAPQAGPVPRARPGDAIQVLSYRHGDKRRNNPHVGMVDAASDGVEEETRWAYDPHIDPALQFDSARARVENLIDDALASGDPDHMRQALQQLKRMQAPYLNWTGKAERTSFEVDTVSLHVHERIDPATIIAAVQKQPKNASSGGRAPSSQTLLPPAGEGLHTPSPAAAGTMSHPSPTATGTISNPSPAGGRGAGVRAAFQPDLFSAPFENLPLREAIAFYKHERDWANRLIAGDSLLVMNSLLQKESMAGQVQMIYIDPPYGIKYGSNFQPFVNKRDVKDRRDEDLTQEPEMIKAFRDTWELGIHSYLTYLRDRLLLARELLSESGSVFVQISDENLHHVRELMDEVFGAANLISQITVMKTSSASSELLAGVADYLVWYAKNPEKLKYRQIYQTKEVGGVGATQYSLVQTPDGRRFPVGQNTVEGNCRLFCHDNTTSQRPPGDFPVLFRGQEFRPGKGYWKTGELGMATLARANRLMVIGNTLRYIRFLDDFPVFPYNNVWTDTGTSGFSDKKTYVVQTNASIAERCLLMTTDPGDLVLDPTCGSGTTAFVAEKWGRRWITCDTSRVAVTLAKQRLLTASYDYYELKYPHEGLKGGFIYKTVPHVTLKSIANNPEIDEIYERMHPAIERALAELNAALQSPSPPAPLPPAGEGKTAEAPLPSAEKGETAEAPLPSAAERGTAPPSAAERGTAPPSAAEGGTAPPSMGKGETALPPTGEWRTTPPSAGEGRTAKASLAPRGEGSESSSPAGERAVASAVTETAGRKVWNESTSPPSPAGGRGAGGEGAEWDYIPHPPARLPEDLKRHARAMRKTATDAENLMWRLLRNRRLANAKFRRQHPIGEYIADFYCDEHGLVVELDGGQHAEQKTYDERRTAFLQSQGLTVLRFWNHQVLGETEAVLQVIWEHVARNDTLTPSPSPAYGRGENENPSPVGGRGENESPSPAGGRRVWDEGVSNPSATGDSLTPTPLPPTGEGLKEWEVPFDFPPGWPASARAPFDAFHAARQAMQRQMDTSIAAHADQETLYDQPLVSKTKLRITGPFTVEAVPFPTVLALEPSPQPLFQGERDVGFVADTAVARSGETSRQARWRDELLKTGIRGKGGQILKLADLEPLPGARYVHAVGTVAEESFPSPQPLSRLRERGLDRVAVSFGPEHAALEQRQVEIAMREAGELFPLPKMLVFCAFTFDPEAAKDIDNIKGITALKVQMNTDLLTEDLKKARASNESFWLMGQPDVEVRRIPSPQPSPGGRGSDWYQVEVHGFDYFDTVTGELKSGGKKQIALWLLDTDYDNRSLFPRQVFFPMAGAKDGWYKLKKDIRAELDEDLLEQFHGTVSLPFEAGENRCIAVKIVDDRGIESLKVMALD
ncbi:DUF559 domain-containing protein [Methylococcus capsulatus]|uniref:DUF559 domain-containing protein n=1 Tax=Methylococcus capsulatus TaxID=414 RepID=UPI001C530F35|nr:DUF559 domain-containing protein [Methylococcus capsulatus]QXP88635.1 DUF559 domain-containing protein [Methylococcus capsulatus]UQN10911.1 DUF559 domain-containing protein [Methylococcus capsulatus]